MRFPEFTEPWETAKLGAIAEFSKGTGISKEQRSETGLPCILYGELYTTYTNEVIEEVVSKTDLDPTDLVKSQKNDVVIPSSGETAEDIATARCVTSDNVLLGGDLNIIRLVEPNDGRFMSYQLNGIRKYDIAKIAQGVSVVHLYGGDLKMLSVTFPQSPEQKKIADCISLLDRRISVQSKLIEQLQSLMGGLMVAHYAKCIKKTVQIKDLGHYFTVMNLSKEELADDGKPCVIYGELFTTYHCTIRDVKSKTLASTDLTLSQSNDLIFPSSTTVDALSLIAPSAITLDNIVLGGDMFGIHVNDDFNNVYLAYLFNYILKHKLAQYAQGSTIIHLHYNDICKANIEVPTLNDQLKFVELADKVHQKIDSEKTLLNNFQVLKAYLLRQMFI